MSQPIEILGDDDDAIVVPRPKARPSPEPSPAPAAASKPAPPARLPFHTLLEFAGIALISAALTAGLVVWRLGPRDSKPTPGDFDPKFVAVGKAYLGDMGSAYGSAWEDGAKILDAGQPIGMALDTTSKAWESNRKAAFNARITPELSKVVAQGKADKDVTSEDRAALSKAYRGLAKGLNGK